VVIARSRAIERADPAQTRRRQHQDNNRALLSTPAPCRNSWARRSREGCDTPLRPLVTAAQADPIARQHTEARWSIHDCPLAGLEAALKAQPVNARRSRPSSNANGSRRRAGARPVLPGDPTILRAARLRACGDEDRARCDRPPCCSSKRQHVVRALSSRDLALWESLCCVDRVARITDVLMTLVPLCWDGGDTRTLRHPDLPLISPNIIDYRCCRRRASPQDLLHHGWRAAAPRWCNRR